jgi:amidase
VAALKPTSGRVPNTGHVPCISALADPRTAIGPLARCVDDLAITLPIVAGVDWCDAGVVPMPLGDPDAVDVTSLRIAHFDRFDGAQPTPEIGAAVEAAVAALALAGARVTAGVPPRIDEALAITREYWARPESMSWKTWRPWGASTLSADEVERSLFEWDRLRRAFLGFMADVDLVVCPVAPDDAPARAESVAEDYVYTLPFSLTGQPCVVVRAATSAGGMPLGVQLVARNWCDHVALAAGRVVERALGGWQPAR